MTTPTTAWTIVVRPPQADGPHQQLVTAPTMSRSRARFLRRPATARAPGGLVETVLMASAYPLILSTVGSFMWWEGCDGMTERLARSR